MKNVIQNAANLIKVKTLVTLTVIGVFAFMAVSGRIDSESVMYIVSTVIAFYFGTQHEKKLGE